jgi:hypothetical protein
MSQAQSPSDPGSPKTEAEALAAGYKRNFVADGPRLSEMIETYRELGFEVITVPISLDSADCNECMKQNPDKFQVIYTRRRPT